MCTPRPRSRESFVDGQYIRHDERSISPLDRRSRRVDHEPILKLDDVRATREQNRPSPTIDR
jgi:hypothetical protein